MFTVQIALGTSGMLIPPHIAEALEQVARRLREYPSTAPTVDIPIRDLHGNVVGHWSYRPDPSVALKA